MAPLFISVSVTPMLLELFRMVPTIIKKPIKVNMTRKFLLSNIMH